MSDLVNTMLGQYQILREIGRGGMAVVYEAYQASLNRTVAVKVLPQQLAFDKTFVQRFLREARAAAKLEHPNIVAIHDVGEYAGHYYIVMQKLAGEPLNGLIQRAGRLPLARAVRIVTQVAEALDYAHTHGIVHRDIKPANIIVGDGDRTWLTDFGIAKAAEGTQVTQTGVVVGTPEYMSPEQATGKPVGPASDIYSLGIVLYQMLTGRVPFEADSTPALLYKHVYDPPAPLRTYAPELPAQVEAALAKALAKDPADRYRTAGEFAGALQVAAGVRAAPIASRAATTWVPVVFKAKANPLLLFLICAAVVVLLVAAVGMTSPLRRAPTPGPTSNTALPPITPESQAPVVALVITPPPSATLAATATDVAVSPARTPTPPPAEPFSGAINSDRLLVRAGPGAGYMVVGMLDAGAPVMVTGRSSDGAWLNIEADRQRRGWVNRQFVQSSQSPDGAPVVPTPSLHKSIQVAQARPDFSDQQGGHDWFYVISETPGSLRFSPMPWDAASGKWYRWCCNSSYDPRMRLSDSGGYPSQAHDVARQWVSPYEGTLRVFGAAYKESGDGLGGNGVSLRIVLNKTILWEGRLSANQSAPLSFDLTAESKVGDALYFIIGANGDDSKDNTIFEPTIELRQAGGLDGPVPAAWVVPATTTPSQTPPPPAQQLCFAPRRRFFEQHLGCCAEVAGLVYNSQGQPSGPRGAVIRIEGPPANDRYVREFAVDASGGYGITALSVDVYTIWLKGPNISSPKYEVRFTVPEKIRELVDFYPVPCR
jgi:uncharacterized protein YraI